MPALSLSVTRRHFPMLSLSLSLALPMPVWLTVDINSTQHVKYTHSYNMFDQHALLLLLCFGQHAVMFVASTFSTVQLPLV